MAVVSDASRVSAGRSLARVLILWHLLSLDAPTVATLWTAFLAHRFGVSLGPVWLVAMFLAVWVLYATDRLLDAAAPRAELEARHHFHARHRRPFGFALAAASIALAWLVSLLPAAALRLYLALGAALAAWLLLIHLPRSRPGAPPRRLPKEFAVGLFFAAAATVPTFAGTFVPGWTVLPPALLFAALCCLNCLFIFAWEHPTPGSRAGAHRSTQLVVRHLYWVAFALIAAALALALAQRSSFPLAIALSAGLLLALERWRPGDAPLLRAAADLALLTPILFL